MRHWSAARARSCAGTTPRARCRSRANAGARSPRRSFRPASACASSPAAISPWRLRRNRTRHPKHEEWIMLSVLGNAVFYLVIAAIIVVFLYSGIRILREYERAVMFTLGRFSGVRGPGLILMIPIVQQMVRVDLRTIVHDVPSQDVISRDNVSVKVNAVVYFRVVDPDKAVIQVENFFAATSQLAQTTLRSVLGKHELDEMLAERDKLNHDIQQILDAQTDAWGIKVANVEIKRIDLDESMVRAIARQAEAERSRRAKIINAEGEQQAAAKLVEAARMLAPVPQAMQLRYLATLFDISNERSSTIVFPFPLDMMKTWLQAAESANATT